MSPPVPDVAVEQVSSEGRDLPRLSPEILARVPQRLVDVAGLAAVAAFLVVLLQLVRQMPVHAATLGAL